MIVDTGIFLSKKTSVCVLGNLVLVSHRSSLKATGVQVPNEEGHSLVHVDSGKTRKQSYLERIADNPLLILRERGRPKTNLKLYVSFVTKGKYKPRIDGTKRQKIIRDIINGEEHVWKRIVSTDVYAYNKLSSTLGIDICPDSNDISTRRELIGISRTVHDKLKQGMCERDAICEILSSGDGLSDSAGFILRTHHDFCTVADRGSFMEDLDREYNRMVDSILHNRPSDEAQMCLIEHPFYNEVRLFNSFVECRGDLSLFDRDMLKKEVFHSITERGVRDFISNEIRKFCLDHHEG